MICAYAAAVRRSFLRRYKVSKSKEGEQLGGVLGYASISGLSISPEMFNQPKRVSIFCLDFAFLSVPLLIPILREDGLEPFYGQQTTLGYRPFESYK
jgi:hypothetical protein